MSQNNLADQLVIWKSKMLPFISSYVPFLYTTDVSARLFLDMGVPLLFQKSPVFKIRPNWYVPVTEYCWASNWSLRLKERSPFYFALDLFTWALLCIWTVARFCKEWEDYCINQKRLIRGISITRRQPEIDMTHILQTEKLCKDISVLPMSDCDQHDLEGTQSICKVGQD